MARMTTEHATVAEEEYLQVLFWLQEAGLPMTGANVARAMQLSPPTVHEMIGRLERDGYITRAGDKTISFTENGAEHAEGIVRRHRLIERFLTDVLGIPWDEVHEEAERLEHVISERMEERIFELLGRPELDPHGHAIPSLDGSVRAVPARPLSECGAGEEVIVRVVSDDDSTRLRELQRRGLMPGARLHVLAGSEFESPIEARMGRRRVSVPLGLAREIFVEAVADY